MYLHAYGKSVIEIATNTIAFVTEFLPFVIKIHGGVNNLLTICDQLSPLK